MTTFVDHANPLQRIHARRNRSPLPRLNGEEELELINDEIELIFRGKHVVAARSLVEFVNRAQHVPGLAESAERVSDFFDDPESGNWVDGSALFRVARADHSNRLKRMWRDFDHRRTTLRQYMRSESKGARAIDYIRFKLPETRHATPKAFLTAFRHMVGGLDRLCRLILDEGFTINGFSERNSWILLGPESQDTLQLGREILEHFVWYRQQSEDVRRLEARKSISVEYAKAAKSLAAAQLRHLGVLVEATVRDHLRDHNDGRFEQALNTAVEYIGVLDSFVHEGAEVAFPSDPEKKPEAA